MNETIILPPVEEYISESWELPHKEKMKIFHAIWLCAWDDKCSNEEINERACKLLRINPVRGLMLTTLIEHCVVDRLIGNQKIH